jgi:hypothetical protein
VFTDWWRPRASEDAQQQPTPQATPDRAGRGGGLPIPSSMHGPEVLVPSPCCFFIHTHKPKNNDCLSSLQYLWYQTNAAPPL